MLEPQVVFSKHRIINGENPFPSINNNYQLRLSFNLCMLRGFKINQKCFCVFQYGTQLYQNYIQPHQKQKASPMVR